jgi:hypothetical protein
VFNPKEKGGKRVKVAGGFMAIDQYGHTEHGLDTPRKALCERLGRSPKSARKMYHDGQDGKAHHIGYVLSGRWFRVYMVELWEGNETRENGGPAKHGA